MGQHSAHSIEGLAVDAEDLRCFGDVSLGEGEDTRYVAPLQFIERREVGGDLLTRCHGRSVRHQQVAGINDGIRGQRQCSFNDIFQFADVAWKRVAHQVLQSVLSDADVAQALALAVLVEEIAHELGNVFLPLAQRRENDFHDLEAIVEILTKLAALDHFFEAAMSGGENSDIDGDAAAAAEFFDFPLLQNAQQLGLQGQGDIAHFIEEHRPASGQLELARPRLDSGSDTALDAEKLRLQQRLRKRRAVDGHERSLFPRRIPVNQPGHHLFTGPRFAADQHVGLAIRYPSHQIDHLLHFGRVADHEPVRVFAEHALLEVPVLILERFADHVEAMVVPAVVDRRGADRGKRREKAEVILDEAAAFRPTLLFPADGQDADHAFAGDHRGDQQVARRAAEKPRPCEGNRLARCQHLLDRRIAKHATRLSRNLESEGKELLDVELFVEREDQPGHCVEHGHRAVHQLFEQLPLRAQRVQRAPDVVQSLQLEEFSSKFELCLWHPYSFPVAFLHSPKRKSQLHAS